MITLERWRTLSSRDQIGHIASEIKRAKLAKQKEPALYLAMIERILYLVQLSLNDPKWKNNSLTLLTIQNEAAKAYIGEGDLDAIDKAL